MDTNGIVRWRITFEFDAAKEWPNIPADLFNDAKAIIESTNGLSIRNLEGTLTKINGLIGGGQ